MVSLLVTVAALALWVLIGVKSLGTLRSGSVPARWLLATLTFLALGISIFVPTIKQQLGDLLPVDQVEEPLARTAVIAAVFCGQTLLGLTGDPISRRRRQLRWVVCGVALVLLWVTFWIGPASPTSHFGSHPVADGSMTVFILAFLVYLAYAVSTVMAGCWRYADKAVGAMALGLRLIAAGCAAALGYAFVKVLAILAFAFEAPVASTVEGTLAQSLVAVGAVLVAVGSAATATSQRVGEARVWCRDWVAHLRLYPLWAALISAVPPVALDPSSGRWQDALRIRDLHLRLYRRLIELRDAWLVLRPYMGGASFDVMKSTPGATGIVERAVVEAAMLRAAVVAKASQQPPHQALSPTPLVTSSMADELEWWLAVSSAWQAQPLPLRVSRQPLAERGRGS